jgi:hypothetical protein
MSESIPGLNFMAKEQRKINPIDDAISLFLKQLLKPYSFNE